MVVIQDLITWKDIENRLCFNTEFFSFVYITKKIAGDVIVRSYNAIIFI